ncbi:MAG: hypothetical protein II187_09105 [Treponema sp.]|nr:hypothetical protein [Treponema sp.]
MKKKHLVPALCGIVLAAAALAAVCVSCTASQRREIKSTVSDYTGGLNRRATLYSSTGEVIKVYEGKIDITSSSENGAVFFDLNGKRIWIKGGILVVEEL